MKNIFKFPKKSDVHFYNNIFNYFKSNLIKNLLLILTITNSLGSNSNALTDPRKNWKTINTPHFEIVFSDSQRPLAQEYAVKAEYVFSVITPHLKEYPEKTIIIINDATDLANGYATRIPYPHIMLYPVLPTSFDTIGEYGDWSYELFLHEFVHILSFEPAHGFMGTLRSVLGTIASPNMLMPRWWLEGLAVEYETRFSSHGRLKSIQQDASLRALELENLFHNFTIDEMNEGDLPSWPRGSRPYVFGSLIMSELIHQKGTQTMNEITQAQSSRVPYFIEEPVYRLTEKDYEAWFNGAISSTQKLVQSQLTELKVKPTTVFTPLPFNSLESRTPSLSPNGQYLTLFFRNQHGKMNIKVLDRKNENRPFDFEKDILEDMNQEKDQAMKTTADQLDAPPGGSINRVSWAEDSSGFIFDKLKFVDSYNYYSDLYFYNFQNRKNLKLTYNLRAREPSLSPSGRRIAFVYTANGTTQLGLIEMQTSVQHLSEENPVSIFEVLYSPSGHSRISSPTFIDENNILFATKHEDGTQSLFKLNILNKGKQPEPIMIPMSNPQFLTVNSYASEKTLLFSANENGTYNGYISTSNFKNIQRLTHTNTAIYDMAYDFKTKELYATVITASGFQVQKTNYQPESLNIKLPQIKPLFQDRYLETTQVDSIKVSSNIKNNNSKNVTEVKAETEAQYNSTSYLTPTYWLPFVYSSGQGLGAQISTTAQDPLDLQNYTAQASWDSTNSQSSIALLYNNQTTEYPVSLLATSIQQENPINKNLTRQFYTKLYLSKDLKPWSDSLSYSVGITDHQISTPNTNNNWHKAGTEIGMMYNSVSLSNFSPVPIGGGYSVLTSSYYPKIKGNYQFDKTTFEGGYYNTKYAPFDGTFMARLKAQYISVLLSPGRQTFDFAASEIFPLTNSLISSGYVLRGYENNYFIFKSGSNTTLEYSLPLPSGGKGWGTIPLFIKRGRIHFFTDLLAVNGIMLNAQTKTYTYVKPNQIFSSYGAEFKLDTTIGYYIPVSWVLGLYMRPDYSGLEKFTTFIGLQM